MGYGLLRFLSSSKAQLFTVASSSPSRSFAQLSSANCRRCSLLMACWPLSSKICFFFSLLSLRKIGLMLTELVAERYIFSKPESFFDSIPSQEHQPLQLQPQQQAQQQALQLQALQLLLKHLQNLKLVHPAKHSQALGFAASFLLHSWLGLTAAAWAGASSALFSSARSGILVDFSMSPQTARPKPKHPGFRVACCLESPPDCWCAQICGAQLSHGQSSFLQHTFGRCCLQPLLLAT